MKKIYFYDREYTKSIDFILKDLPLNMDLVNKKCFEYFRDSDPCIIHINYVSKKIIIEIEKMIEEDMELNKHYEISNATLINQYIDIPKNYALFSIKNI